VTTPTHDRRAARLVAVTATTLAASIVFGGVALIGFGVGYSVFLNDRNLTAGLAAIGCAAGALGGAIAGGGIALALRPWVPRRGWWALATASVWTLVGGSAFAAQPGAWPIIAGALGSATYVGAVATVLLAKRSSVGSIPTRQE
jgi:hypothetical protein